MSAKKIYAIANSHLDPIWLWRRHAGESSMLNTARSAVAILEENPDLKFSCSSAAFYRWCEENSPQLFKRIIKLVERKQWEIVGGWEVQSDALIAPLEVLLRQAESGQEYFKSRFGFAPKIAYSVDAFGHTAMLPAILNQHGFTHYVYVRGRAVKEHLFRWKSADNSSVIAQRLRTNYAQSAFTDKKAFFDLIEEHLTNGDDLQILFWGLGDHGGGLSRKHLSYLREAAESMPIKFATLEEYFADVASSEMELVEYSGEISDNIGHCSANHAVKALAAKTVKTLLNAEKLNFDGEKFELAERELLFNYFHDIVPGTSIREAYTEDIYPSLGFSKFTAQKHIDKFLAKAESSTNLSFVKEGGVQIWNPIPRRREVVAQIDGFTDPEGRGENFCSVKNQFGEIFPLQILRAASCYGPFNDPWGRFTAIVPIEAMGYEYLAFSREKTNLPKVGFERLEKLIKRLSVQILPDNNGSWGFTMQPFGKAEKFACLKDVTKLSSGQVCAEIEAVYEYENSEIRLILSDFANQKPIKITATICNFKKDCCIKLGVKFTDNIVEFATGNPAGITMRQVAKNFNSSEEYAFNDFFTASSKNEKIAILASDLHSCDCECDCMRLTMLRPSRYADFVEFPCYENEGIADIGYTYLEFYILVDDFADISELPKIAENYLNPPEVREITGHLKEGDYPKNAVKAFDLANSPCIVTSVSKRVVTIWNPSNKTETAIIYGKTYQIAPFAIKKIFYN